VGLGSLRFATLSTALLTGILVLSPASATRATQACAAQKNCIYEIPDDSPAPLIWGERVKFVSCWSGPRRLPLQVNKNGAWVQIAISKVSVSPRKCGSKKFKFRKVYTWQVSVLPTAGERLQIREFNGSNSSYHLFSVYASKDAWDDAVSARMGEAIAIHERLMKELRK